MPEYLSPGVYVEEVASGPRPIEGVSTSTAGFAGQTERGPSETRLVTSWPDFTRWYGGTLDTGTSYLPFAVRGFFENGGQRLFVARATDPAAQEANLELTAGAGNSLILRANGSGAWGENLLVRVLEASKRVAHPEWFRLVVIYYRRGLPQPFVDPLDRNELANPDRVEPDLIEDFDDLSFDSGRSNSVETVVNTTSRLIQVAGWSDPANPARPDEGSFTALANGTDGTVTVEHYGFALDRLEAIDEISILAAPDEVGAITDASEITNALIGQCERLRDRFALYSVAAGSADVATIPEPRDTTYGALYYPWLRVFDPRIQEDVLVPPVGHVAGIYARTDVDRGVHKAPANEVVRGLYYGDPFGQRQPLEFRVTKRQHDLLNPRGINVIRDFRSDGRGIRVWGARTMASDPLWRYVNVRRLFLFIEESIDEGTQWVVFEPNYEPTWAAVRRSVTNFLLRVWRSGALQGVTQDEAFFVKCDRTTMTPDDIDNGRLICLIGVAPVKPAEFVIFRISQKTVEAE